MVIPLDPAKSPQGNLDDYFKKHRKYVAAERELRPRLTRAEEEVAGLHAERTKVEGGILPPDSALVKRTDKQSAFSRLPSLKTKDDTRAGPFRRFLSLDGLPIYVGRNAKENEALTFGEARPDDLWLHAHGTPGSHGQELVHRVLKLKPQTRVLLISAYTNDELREQGIEREGLPFLPKPFSPDALLQGVRGALAGPPVTLPKVHDANRLTRADGFSGDFPGRHLLDHL